MPRAPHASTAWIVAFVVFLGLACLPAALARSVSPDGGDGDASEEAPDTGKDDTGADPFV